jgi:hypothetical protein
VRGALSGAPGEWTGGERWARGALSGAPGAPTEGERWVRGALSDLRAAGYAPGAVAHFLAASQRRANATRRARPELARQSRRWLAAGAVAYAPLRVRRRSALAWWTGAALMVDWHLGMVETEDGLPRRLGPADAATLLRAWLVPVVTAQPSPAVLLAGYASDVADGVLARRSLPTRAGRDLEGAVDAAFTVAALRGLTRRRALGRAAAAAEAARVLSGTAHTLASYFGAARPPDARLAHAARASTPLRAAGLLAASAGRRRTGDVRLLAGALAGAAGTANVARTTPSGGAGDGRSV